MAQARVNGLPGRARAAVIASALGALIVGATWVAPAHADVVYRAGGGKVVGRVVEEDEEKVVVETRTGRVTVYWSEIDRVERGPVEDLPPPAPKPIAPKPEAPAAPKPPAPKPAAPQPKPHPEATGAAAGAGTSSGEAEPAAAEASLELLLGQLRSRDAARREEAMAALAKTADGKAALAAELLKEVDKRDKALFAWFKSRRDKLRRVLAERAIVYRAEAYAFIMDPAKYPDENHGAVAQPEVDRLVRRLERAWSKGYEAVLEESEEARELEKDLRDLDAAAQKHIGGEAAPALEVDARIEKRKLEINQMLSLVGVPLDQAEQRTLEESEKSTNWNRTCPTSVDEEERNCIEATNRYRMMFGLSVLRIDERLVKAARGHSKDMVDHDFFDHDSPVPGKRTPDARCRAEGANYSGENIAMGSSTGRATFHQWYTSSGHHRNILTKGHLTIGIGRHRSHWTQNFGMDRVP